VRVHFRQRVFAVVAALVEVFLRRLMERDVGAVRFVIRGFVFWFFNSIKKDNALRCLF
jgi:hypothetical protein